MYPMKLLPVYKDYIWGGNTMKALYRKQNDLRVTAESWELSCHPDGESRIANGVYAGRSLSEVLAERPEYVSDQFHAQDRFPILIKLIDAAQDLSVQVHPSDENADPARGEQGKAELWYVVQCEPAAYIYYGLNQEVSRERLIRRAEDGSICKILNKVPVHPGDVFFIRPGTIHALGKGVIAAEIQQNSNTTFRVFDYCRKDAAGQTRPLHLQRAAEVIDYRPVIPGQAGENNQMYTGAYAYAQIFSCDAFRVSRIRCRDAVTLRCGAESFHSLLVIAGEGTLRYGGETYALPAGESYFLPAASGVYEIRTETGMELLLSRIA